MSPGKSKYRGTDNMKLGINVEILAEKKEEISGLKSQIHGCLSFNNHRCIFQSEEKFM